MIDRLGGSCYGRIAILPENSYGKVLRGARRVASVEARLCFGRVGRPGREAGHSDLAVSLLLGLRDVVRTQASAFLPHFPLQSSVVTQLEVTPRGIRQACVTRCAV